MALINSVSNGKFNTALKANAVKYNAPGLAKATSAKISVTNLNPEPRAKETSAALKETDIIAIALSLLGIACLCGVCYYRRSKKGASRGGASDSAYGGRGGGLASYGYEDDHDTNFYNVNRSPSPLGRDVIPPRPNYAASFDIHGRRGSGGFGGGSKRLGGNRWDDDL